MMERGVISLISAIILFKIIQSSTFKNHFDTSNEYLKYKQIPCRQSYESESRELTVAFPEHGEKDSISKYHVCWNQSSEMVYLRTCNADTGYWQPQSSDCFNFKNPVICPNNLNLISSNHQKRKVCVKISNISHPFQERRFYGSNSLLNKLDKEEIKNLNLLLEAKNIYRFWMPIRKGFEGEYCPLLIRLPGKQWGQAFEDVKISTLDLYSQNHCLSASITNKYKIQYELVDCNSNLHSVVIYKQHFVTLSGCPQGFGAMIYKPDHCYGVKWQASLFTHDIKPLSVGEYLKKRTEIQSIFEYTDIHTDSYFMVGEISNGTQKYAIEMNKKEEFLIVPFDDRQPALSSEYLRNKKNVFMTLKMSDSTLILTVYNRNYIWRYGEEDSDDFGIRCFLGTWSPNNLEIEMIWQNDLQTKTLFKIHLDSNDSGYYWCEAHTIFNFSKVSTEKVFISRYKTEHVFISHIVVLCNNKTCSDVYNKRDDFRQQIKYSLEKSKSKAPEQIFDDFEIEDVRIMKVGNISENGKKITLICHMPVVFKNIRKDTIPGKARFNSVDGEIALSMKLQNFLFKLLSYESIYSAQTVRHIVYCFPEYLRISANEQTYWNLAKFGELATTRHLCLNHLKVPITRKCIGNYIEGAQWEPFNLDDGCFQKQSLSNLTNYLYDLNRKVHSAPETIFTQVHRVLTESVSTMIPADFYYTAEILKYAIPDYMKKIETPFAEKEHGTKAEGFFGHLVEIYDNILNANTTSMMLAATMNSSNLLLETFERTIDNLSMGLYNVSDINTTENNENKNTAIYLPDIGVRLHQASNVLIFIINPNIANVSGVALFRKNEDNSGIIFEKLSGSFQNEIYRFILANETADDLLYAEQLLLATFIPKTLLERLHEIPNAANITNSNTDDIRVVIKIYGNDVLFQEIGEKSEDNNQVVSGKIMSVSLPGYSANLPEMIPLIFREHASSQQNDSNNCRYWNYKNWAEDGVSFLGRSAVDKELILCGCSHVTPFAYLIGANQKIFVESNGIKTSNHKVALDIISILGCSLSLFGTFGIFVTAITFQSWRQKASSKILLQLSIAIAFQMILFCFVNTEDRSYHLVRNRIYTKCIIIGALMHYSVLAEFCWMLIIAYLQFKRYVQVFGNIRPKRFFVKSSLFGWIVPIIPVLIVLVYNRRSYIPENISKLNAFCYPTGYALYFGVILPICAIVFSNFVVFIYIIYNITQTPEGSIRTSEKKLFLSQVRLSVLLFFLLGFTWVFGLLSTMKVGIVFSYIFCLTATIQGFVLFIYFIILDPVTRRMWCGNINRIFGLNIQFDQTSSSKEMTSR